MRLILMFILRRNVTMGMAMKVGITMSHHMYTITSLVTLTVTLTVTTMAITMS